MVAMMTISMVACGEETTSAETNEPIAEEETTSTETNEPISEIDGENPVYHIGDVTTSKSGRFETTLTDVQFVERLDFDRDSQTFCMQADENDDTLVLKAQNDNIFLTFTLTYKFVGKEDYDLGRNLMCYPTVSYGDGYSFTADHMTFVNYEGLVGWHFLHTDASDGKRESVGFGQVGFVDNTYKPLDSTVYEVRGFIAVPKEVMENTEEPLSITFDIGGTYTIR